MRRTFLLEFVVLPVEGAFWLVVVVCCVVLFVCSMGSCLRVALLYGYR